MPDSNSSTREESTKTQPAPPKLWLLEVRNFKVPTEVTDSTQTSIFSRLWQGGRFLTSRRSVGIEFEVVVPNRIIGGEETFSYDPSGNPIRGKVNAELSDSKNFYSTLKKLDKNIGYSTDGSIGDRGIEIRTSPLSGKKLENMLSGIGKLFKEGDIKATIACGLHIHVDMNRDFKIPGSNITDGIKLWYLVRLYRAIDPWINLIIAPRRRNGNYSHSFDPNYDKRLSTKPSNRESYPFNDLQTKYYGVNVRYLGNDFSNKHIEIRYHQGTVNSKEVLHWANLHTNLIDSFSKLYDKGNEADVESLIKLMEETPDKAKDKILRSHLSIPSCTLRFYRKKIKTNRWP